MAARRTTGLVRSLPCEIMGEFFQALDIWALLNCSHICSAWRRTVHDHPRFWRYIRADSTSWGHVKLTQARMEAAQTRPFVLELIFPEYDHHVERRVLPLIKHALNGVQCLRITMDEVLVSILWDHRLDDAPKLSELQVILCGSPAPILPRHDPLSPLIFGGNASQIKKLTLKNVLLPDIPVPALEAAEDVTLLFEANTTQHFPAYLFRYFPFMRRLRLSGGSIAAPPAELPEYVDVGVRRLQYLDLETCDDDTTPFLERLPSKEIDEIVVAYPDDDSVYAALSGLLHPFHMSFQPDFLTANDFEIGVHSPRLNLRRRFIEARSDYAGELQINPLLANEYFPAQVHWLSITLSLWPLVVPCLLGFDDLDELTLLVDVVDCFSAAVSTPVRCNSLRRLALKAMFATPSGVPARWIVALVETTTSHKSALILENLYVRDADEPCLRDRFSVCS